MADPHGGGGDTVTTTVVPEPKAPAPQHSTAKQPTVAQTTVAPAPVPEAPAPQPATKAAPATQAPAVVEPAPAPEPQTQAPIKTSTAVVTAEPTTTAQPSTTVERSPVTTAAPSATSAAPAAPDTTTKAAATSSPSAALAPASESATPASEGATSAPDTKTPASDAKTPAASAQTSASATATGERSGGSETPTVSITQAAKEIELLAPETLEAPAEDVELAKNAKPVFEPQPAAAPERDVAAFKSSVDTTLGLNGAKASASAKAEIEAKRNRDFQLVSNVRQWQPDWISYDEYYRPVLLNPYRAPVRIAYLYQNAPRIVVIPPLARMVIEAAQFAAYSFTAAVLAPVALAAGAVNMAIDAAQAVTNIAVGSFFGGGYFPGAGLPLPPPPPPVLRYDNVPVMVKYSQATYEPFRVRQIIDVGDDPQYGARKALLDGATPVWGQWTQTPSGERQFEVHKTQQFPGLDAPQEGPLPGDYRLRLASDQASTGGLTGRDIFLMVSAGVIGTLGFGAIGLAFFIGRRRPEHQ